MTYDLAIPALTFFSVTAIGGAVLSARASRRKSLAARLSGASLDPAAELSTQDRPWFQIAHKVGTAVGPADPSAKLRRQMARAGYFGRSAVPIFLGSKMILMMLGLAAATVLVSPLQWQTPVKILAVLAAGTLLFMLPNIVVDLRRQRRAQEVRNHLPDVVDLLEVCVSAGMGLDMAWNSVAEEIRRVSGVLADEMSLTNLEIHFGAERADAMRHMADRTGAGELSSLVAVLVQSERFGTSMREALRTFAQTMRELRSQRAEEAAEKMSVKMLFPLVLFIFPPIVIVTAGPAAIKLTQLFGR